jgi:RTX calcium-binding nonapeptide repeat (4 copies)
VRRAAVLAALAATGALAGCVGDTSPATNVRATQAQLNGHGHTNNGPAYWWWEYATTRAAVNNGQGTKTPRQGPASSSVDVSVNRVVTGLDPAQTYYFRACGQDQKAGSPAVCGTTRHFGTAPADSTAAVVGDGTGNTDVEYRAASATAHDLVLSGSPNTAQIREYEDQDHQPLQGADIIPGAGCSGFTSSNGISYYDSVSCTSNTNRVNLILSSHDDNLDNQATTLAIVNLSGGNDVYTTAAAVAVDLIYGGTGNDEMFGSALSNYYNGGDGADLISTNAGHDEITGGNGNDTIYAGDDADTIYGNDGDDVIYGGRGIDTYDCGPGEDVIHIGIYDEWASHSTGCEGIAIDDPQ